MPTVAEIAKAAFDGASAAIPDSVHVATLSHDARGSYDAAAGTYSTTTTTATGRALIDTVKPIADIFPEYVVGPKDELILLEGFTSVPEENWKLTIKAKLRTIKAVQDIVQAGSLFYVVATG